VATAHLGIARLSAFLVDEFRETWPEPDILFNTAEIRWRDEGLVRNKAVYVALALDIEGEKEVLGLWIEQTEGAKFWLNVMNELKTRGVADILIAVVDGLKGFPDAIGTVFPL
jgi:putative transposase